jgi:hypothetical protein
MMTVLLVAMFAVGIALLLLSANTLALYRSKLPRERQGGAGAKSVWLIVAGVALVGTALTWFVLRSVSST